jgi:hypothetical protein
VHASVYPKRCIRCKRETHASPVSFRGTVELKAGVRCFNKVYSEALTYSTAAQFTLGILPSIELKGIAQSFRDRYILNLPDNSLGRFRFSVEGSTNLFHWYPLGTNVPPIDGSASTGTTWTVTNSTHLPRQYFRIREF